MESFNQNESVEVSISGFDLRAHVIRAIRIAFRLNNGGPINAKNALLAAVMGGAQSKSEAFNMLSSIIRVELPKSVRAVKNFNDPPSFFSASPALAKAFETARPFLKEGNSIWGRDYVTFALLATDDPSLDDLAQENSLDLSAIRDEWFRFVTRDNNRRNRAAWTDWWNKAGVTPPSSTFLFTWDPTRYSFENLQTAILGIENTGTAKMSWNAGHEDVLVGDRVFMMRHGEIDPGLIGSGRVIEKPILGPYWDAKQAEAGRDAWFALVQWDTLQEYPLLSRGTLEQKTGEVSLWTAWGSGHLIPYDLATKIEDLWRETKKASPQSGTIPPPVPFCRNDLVPTMFDSRFQAGTHDSLDVKVQAEVFGSLLVSAEVEPPFALALLGDWGVGKSFFMRLIQERVKAISASDAEIPSSVRVAQIEFNAWHYVDSDLWASLASRIFDMLALELNDKGKEIENTRQRLHNGVESSKRERDAAEEAIKAAEVTRQAAAKELNEKQATRSLKAAEREEHRLKRLWEAILTVTPTEENPDWPDVADLKAKADGIARSLGITEAMNSIREVQHVYASLQDLRRRGSTLSLMFSSLKGEKPTYTAIMTVCAIVLAVLAYPFILGKFEEWWFGHETELYESGALLLQLSTILGGLVAWVVKRLKMVSSAISYIEKIQEEIVKPREMEEVSEEAVLHNKIDALDAEIASQQSRLDEADRQIAEAQAKIQHINVGGLVYDFLLDRSKDSRYQSKLGLISLIRQDFERLDGLLEEWAQDNNCIRGENYSSSTQSSRIRPIKRIVLYIDDLDRCPAWRVVEVLQAVHLLLAFDLFVVIVAVDARWLERSLNQEYNRGIDVNGSFTSNHTQHPFSAHNYLEKIFQIPFSLPAMSGGGYEKLIHNLMTPPTRFSPEPPPENESEKGSATSLEDPVKEAQPSQGIGIVEGDTSKQATDVVVQHEIPEVQNNLPSILPLPNAEEVSRKRIEAMRLFDWEEQFAQAMFSFIETPRLAGRFVNIYRLLRIRAYMMDGGFERFVERDSGDYRAVLVLLAISVGYGDDAPDILNRLSHAKGSSLALWFESELEEVENIEEARRRVLRSVWWDIVASKERLIEKSAPAFDDALSTYAKWAREVGPYSFYWRPISIEETPIQRCSPAFQTAPTSSLAPKQ